MDSKDELLMVKSVLEETDREEEHIHNFKDSM